MKHLLLFYDDQMYLFCKYMCVHEAFTFILWWTDEPVSSTSVFMKALLLFHDDQINLLQILVCSWNFYSYFMIIRYTCFKYYCVHETFTLISCWSDKPVLSTIVFMKILLLFYDNQINLFQVIMCSWNFFTLNLWWSDKPASNTSVFIKLLLLFFDDQINLLQVLVCSWNVHPYFMMIR